MKIDFDTHQGNVIADMEISILSEQQNINLIQMLKPEFSKDGDRFCFTYPSQMGLPNNCIQGFGETAAKAALDFSNNWYSEKAKK